MKIKKEPNLRQRIEEKSLIKIQFFWKMLTLPSKRHIKQRSNRIIGIFFYIIANSKLMREKKFNVGNTGWLSLNSLDLRKDNDNSNSSTCVTMNRDPLSSLCSKRFLEPFTFWSSEKWSERKWGGGGGERSLSSL